MLIPEILILTAAALLFRLLGRGRMRAWLVFAASILCVFWLQPVTPIRYLDFWLPVATLALAAFGWLLSSSKDEEAPYSLASRENLLAGELLIGMILLVGLTRYVGEGDWFAPARPPAVQNVLVVLALLALAAAALGWAFYRRGSLPGVLITSGIIVLIALLILIKSPALALEAAKALRGLAGQNASLATATDLRWLGFSYVCFRLIHTLRDRQTGRLPQVDLRTYVSYVVFFPSFVAGPIDRLERFARDDCQTGPGFAAALRDPQTAEDFSEAGRRLVIGLFKKFAIADTLALVALSPQNAPQVRATGWLWVMLYLYALQIYFDFSGYTDIAIALGRILGYRLPENFNAPYLKPNLTQFWNSWHMSLTLWFRAYFFNPFVRWLRGPKVKAEPVAVLFLSQACTMLLIGLWHGVTWNFVLWGLWHGLGLFVQNRWTDLTRPWFAAHPASPVVQRGLSVFSTLLTFHYVALGWVWFVLPATPVAGQVMLRLFGMGG